MQYRRCLPLTRLGRLDTLRPMGRGLTTGLGVALLAASCASPAGYDSPSPAGSSPSPATTAATPTGPIPSGDSDYPPVVSPLPGILPPGSVAVVTVNELRVRRGPPGLPEFDEIVGLLSAGDRVIVSFSPFSYLASWSSPDGRGWYAVEVVGGDVVGNGYVTEGEVGLEFLEMETAPCPGPGADLRDLLNLATYGPPISQAWDRLACVGDEPLVLEGMIDLACLGDGIYPFTFEPPWLAYPAICLGLGVADPNAQGFNLSILPLRFRDGVYEDWQRGDLVRVRGHFDDVAAADCRIEPPDFPGQLPEPANLVLYCREQFVVDELTVTGHYDLPPQY